MPLCMSSSPLIEQNKVILKKEVIGFNENGLKPDLIVFVNNDPASQVYVRNKVKFGDEIGIKVVCIAYGTVNDILDVLKNKYPHSPFIIQEPTPVTFTPYEVNNVLNEFMERDMDCFSSNYFGKLALDLDSEMKSILPCTPSGIVNLLHYYDFLMTKNTFAIVGRSKIVGKPLAAILQEIYNKTVLVCHSYTSNEVKDKIFEISDVIISAVGKPYMYSNNKGLEGKVLVDVGINRNENNKLCGDFAPEILEKSLAYTPVPGGVGPMTVEKLFENTVEYWNRYLIEKDLTLTKNIEKHY